jgi:hypothetical protein
LTVALANHRTAIGHDTTALTGLGRMAWRSCSTIARALASSIATLRGASVIPLEAFKPVTLGELKVFADVYGSPGETAALIKDLERSALDAENQIRPALQRKLKAVDQLNLRACTEGSVDELFSAHWQHLDKSVLKRKAAKRRVTPGVGGT